MEYFVDYSHWSFDKTSFERQVFYLNGQDAPKLFPMKHFFTLLMAFAGGAALANFVGAGIESDCCPVCDVSRLRDV